MFTLWPLINIVHFGENHSRIETVNAVCVCVTRSSAMLWQFALTKCVLSMLFHVFVCCTKQCRHKFWIDRSDFSQYNLCICLVSLLINFTFKMLKQKKKQKQIRLNLEEKVKVLKKLDNGVRANRLAIDFNVSEAAICKIKKNRDQIMQTVSNSHHEMRRKTLHKAEFEDLEMKLNDWFLKQRERNCPMNGPLICAKARDPFTKLYPEKSANDFHASDGWFQEFKRRFGMRFVVKSFQATRQKSHHLYRSSVLKSSKCNWPTSSYTMPMNQASFFDYYQTKHM